MYYYEYGYILSNPFDCNKIGEWRAAHQKGGER